MSQVRLQKFAVGFLEKELEEVYSTVPRLHKLPDFCLVAAAMSTPWVEEYRTSVGFLECVQVIFSMLINNLKRGANEAGG